MCMCVSDTRGVCGVDIGDCFLRLGNINYYCVSLFFYSHTHMHKTYVCVCDHGVCECTCERMYSLPQTHLSLKWDTSHTHALLTLPTHTHHSHHTHITCLQVALYPCLLEHDLNQIVNWIVDDLMTMPLRTITRQCEVNIEDTTCFQSTSGCKEGGSGINLRGDIVYIYYTVISLPGS